MNEIIIELKDYFEEIEGAKGITILPKTNLKIDLGLDSLRLVETIIDIEERFNITIDESNLNPNNMKTVEDLAIIINKSLKKE